MSKSQIKFKNLNENQTIQMIDLDDYFGDGIPKITKPLTKLQFIKKYLSEILDDEDSGVDDVNEAFEMIDSHGDGDSNKVFITIEDGEAKIVLS
jgi:hypothetical protein